VSAGATIRREGVPVVFGVACLLALIALIEVLIRIGMINPFIVPKPTDIVMSFERIIMEENILPRFFLTCGEALMASLMLSVAGISIGVLLQKPHRPPRHRDLGGGGGVGAARLDVSLVPGDFRPQRLDHHHDRLRLGAAAGDPEDAGRAVWHAAGADQCRAKLQAHALAALLENPVSLRAADHLRRRAARHDLRADQSSASSS